MEAIVLCGVQGSGKTTLCRDRFADSHVRVSLDELGSRGREAALVEDCLAEGRPFVVDATNPTAADRARYVAPARAAGFKVVAYLVEVDAAEAFARNAGRAAGARIPPGDVAATARRFVSPTLEEGFDELWHATAAPGGGWRIEPLLTTPPLF
jgi:predicted kinase